MKIILLLMSGLFVKSTTGQSIQLKETTELKTIGVPPGKALLFTAPFISIESYVKADINRKLFSNTFYYRLQKEQADTKSGYTDFIKQRMLFFDQTGLNKTILYKPGSLPFNNITMILGSFFNIMLQQYITQNGISH